MYIYHGNLIKQMFNQSSLFFGIKLPWSIFFPDSLFEIAGNAVNQLKEPVSWSWSVSNVMDWVQYGLRLPQYVIIFKENHIDGKKLIFINCQTLPSMHITDFDHIKYIAKNVRHLYGLPPDTKYHNGISGQWSVYHTVGRYYLHLATTFAASGRRSGTAGRGVQETLSLFDYMQSIGMVTDARHHGPRTSGCRTNDWPPPPPKHKIMLARLPATEYLRGGQCAHADQAVVRLRPMQLQACMEPPPSKR